MRWHGWLLRGWIAFFLFSSFLLRLYDQPIDLCRGNLSVQKKNPPLNRRYCSVALITEVCGGG